VYENRTNLVPSNQLWVVNSKPDKLWGGGQFQKFVNVSVAHKIINHEKIGYERQNVLMDSHDFSELMQRLEEGF